jgi:hypothetical protein
MKHALQMTVAILCILILLALAVLIIYAWWPLP